MAAKLEKLTSPQSKTKALIVLADSNNAIGSGLLSKNKSPQNASNSDIGEK